MGLDGVQNVVMKSLDAQALAAQSAFQGEIAMRQAEKHLALERLRRESLVAEGGEPASSDEAGLALPLRLPAEKQRRYRLAWKAGQGAVLELDQEPGRALRLDLNA